MTINALFVDVNSRQCSCNGNTSSNSPQNDLYGGQGLFLSGPPHIRYLKKNTRYGNILQFSKTNIANLLLYLK